MTSLQLHYKMQANDIQADKRTLRDPCSLLVEFAEQSLLLVPPLNLMVDQQVSNKWNHFPSETPSLLKKLCFRNEVNDTSYWSGPVLADGRWCVDNLANGA
jgi:hypothetical protein